jgi:hypothetical protein
MYGYLEPREVPEGELELTKTVYCQNENCAEHEMEHEVNVLVVYVGDSGSATYTCHRCELESEFEFDLDAEDFGFDPDAWGDARRDEGY